jgi:tetratricopeptide (TPR) repeat protein
VYAALGQLNRRRGAAEAALQAFSNAVRYGNNKHPDGLLGAASLMLDQENPGNGYCLAAKNVKDLAAMTDLTSPRQQATNDFIKALLYSRVSRDIPQYTDKNFQKTLTECTGVPADAAAVAKEISDAEKAGLSLDANNPELLLIRGRRLAWEGKVDEGAAEIKKAIAMSPQASQFHVELAKVLSRKEGGEAAAEEALKNALTLVPNSPKLLSMLGQAQYKQKKFDAARDTLEKALTDAKTKNPEARYLLGKIYRDEKKDYAKAADLLKKAAEEYFTDPTMASVAFDDLAQTYELKGDKDSALSTYEKALNADKDNAMPYCHYARLLAKDPKEKDKAKTIAQAFLKMAPQDACAADMKNL